MSGYPLNMGGSGMGMDGQTNSRGLGNGGPMGINEPPSRQMLGQQQMQQPQQQMQQQRQPQQQYQQMQQQRQPQQQQQQQQMQQQRQPQQQQMQQQPKSTADPNRHFLFYSHTCQFSNEIHQKITKFNLEGLFYLINLSDPRRRIKIPPMVKKVPTILMNDKKTVLSDDRLVEFINELNRIRNKSTIEDNNTGGNFAILSKDGTELADVGGSAFGMIDKDQRIYTPDAEYDNFKKTPGANPQLVQDQIHSMESGTIDGMAGGMAGFNSMGSMGGGMGGGGMGGGQLDMGRLQAERDKDINIPKDGPAPNTSTPMYGNNMGMAPMSQSQINNSQNLHMGMGRDREMPKIPTTQGMRGPLPSENINSGPKVGQIDLGNLESMRNQDINNIRQNPSVA
jgi:flagellar motor protein MotB